MASEVDICNLALAHLGDTANIASLTERSVQAQLCSRFYVPSRDALLEMAAWGFATRRQVLAEVTNISSQWLHTYSMPASVLKALAVLDKDAPADYDVNLVADPSQPWPQGYVPARGAIVYTPQPYTIETDDKGNSILLTDQCDALLRYTAKVTDTTKFTPLFTLALSHLLASQLAGPIIKGDAGRAETAGQLKIFQAIEAQAEISDANQVKTAVEVSVPWIAGR